MQLRHTMLSTLRLRSIKNKLHKRQLLQSLNTYSQYVPLQFLVAFTIINFYKYF